MLLMPRWPREVVRVNTGRDRPADQNRVQVLQLLSRRTVGQWDIG